MEVSVIGSSQVNVGRINDVRFSMNLSSNFINLKNNHSKSNLVLNQSLLWPGFSLRASASASAHNQAVVSRKSSKITTTKAVRLYLDLFNLFLLLLFNLKCYMDFFYFTFLDLIVDCFELLHILIVYVVACGLLT